MSAIEHPIQSTGEPFIERELAYREADGLQVRLWWLGGTATKVTMEDRKAKPRVFFEVPTPEGISPNDVFNHPFSYLNGVPDGRGSE